MPTLASGTKMANRYPDLGGFVGPMIPPPETLRAFIIGYPGEGKSCFLQSNPDAFIFNLDLSGTTCPNPQAVIWPGVDQVSGKPTGLSAGQDSLSWDGILEKVKVLKTMATSNKPRPKTVVIDSLSSALDLLRVWIPQNAKVLGIASESKDSWRQIDGRSGYDEMYNAIVGLMNELHGYGYGVYIIGHVVNAKTQLGENEFVIKPELTITDNFWKRLYYHFDMVAAVTRTKKMENVKREVSEVVRGKTTTLVKTFRESVERHVLSVDSDQLSGILKGRVEFPEPIVLSKDNGWADYVAGYQNASTSTPTMHGDSTT